MAAYRKSVHKQISDKKKEYETIPIPHSISWYTCSDHIYRGIRLHSEYSLANILDYICIHGNRYNYIFLNIALYDHQGWHILL